MEKYSNRGSNSGIYSYEIGRDFIIVQFNDGCKYLYTCTSTGSANIRHMKTLALAGKGLNSFINKNVRKKYAKKW